MKNGAVMVLGAGGHARVVVMALAAMGFGSGIFLDDDALKRGVPFVGGWRYAGQITQAVMREQALAGVRHFIVGFGSVDADGCARRDERYMLALASGLVPLSAISPNSWVEGHLGDGVFIGPGAIVMPGAVIGGNSIINTGAIVEHDCKVGWSCHIATGAILCGGVKVGKQVHVGAGAVVKQGVKIGDHATVGMGAVVLEDVPEGVTVVGNPARVLERAS